MMVEARDVGLLVCFPPCTCRWPVTPPGERVALGGSRGPAGGLVQGQCSDREWRPVALCHRDGSAVAQEGPPVAGEYADPEDL